MRRSKPARQVAPSVDPGTRGHRPKLGSFSVPPTEDFCAHSGGACRRPLRHLAFCLAWKQTPGSRSDILRFACFCRSHHEPLAIVRQPSVASKRGIYQESRHVLFDTGFLAGADAILPRPFSTRFSDANAGKDGDGRPVGDCRTYLPSIEVCSPLETGIWMRTIHSMKRAIRLIC